MLEWLSKMFETMCSVCVIMNFVIYGVMGGIIGDKIGNGDTSKTLLCFIIGLAIAFFINVINFGFLAQIIQIRKKVDSLAKNSEVNK